MKKIVTTLLLCSGIIELLADTPGKRVMQGSAISFQDVQKCSSCVFYWKEFGADRSDTIKKDTSVVLIGSGGAPVQYMFWGIQKPSNKSTDTVYFSNYYSPDYVLILKEVKNDSIIYTQKELSNGNTIINEGNTDSIANKQLVADANAYKRNHLMQYCLLYGAGIAGLGGLIWFFIRRRKNKNTTAQGTGS